MLIAILFSMILLDQLVKYSVRQWGGFYICNEGIAFGLTIHPYLFWIFWITIILIMSILLISKLKFQISNQAQISKSKKFDIWILDFIWNLIFGFWTSKKYILSIILILSGAISNIIDRLYFGCVIDFIHIPFWPAIFNLADVFITIGTVILLVKIFRIKK